MWTRTAFNSNCRGEVEAGEEGEEDGDAVVVDVVDDEVVVVEDDVVEEEEEVEVLLVEDDGEAEEDGCEGAEETDDAGNGRDASLEEDVDEDEVQVACGWVMLV